MSVSSDDMRLLKRSERDDKERSITRLRSMEPSEPGLGEDNAAQLFQQTLDEEKEADKRLTQIAEGSVNVEAAKKQMTASQAK